MSVFVLDFKGVPMRPSKCARITFSKVPFLRETKRLLSTDYALFDGRLSNTLEEETESELCQIHQHSRPCLECKNDDADRRFDAVREERDVE